MKSSAMYSLCILAFPALISAVSLLEALNAAGASSFAQELQADPDIWALYTSSSVQTVYAIPDVSYSNDTLRRRQNQPQDARRKRMQGAKKHSDMEGLGLGDVIPTNAENPKDPSNPHPAVSGPNDPESPSNNTKHRRQSSNGTFPSTPISISSGLGNKVNLVRGDIPYDGGLIHLVDDYFTVPVAFNETINSTGLSTLESLLARANLSDTFTNSQTVTVFTPSNAAFAAAGNSTNVTTPALRDLLLNHIVPDFAGYLPLLKDGDTYTTLAGSQLTIAVRDNKYFVNGAQIVSANTITDNGVAHVINGVLTPTPPPFTGAGAGWTPRPVYSLVAALAAVLFLQF